MCVCGDTRGRTCGRGGSRMDAYMFLVICGHGNAHCRGLTCGRGRKRVCGHTRGPAHGPVVVNVVVFMVLRFVVY